MIEIPIIWKIFIAFTWVIMFVIGAYLGLRVLKLSKRVKSIQKDRDKVLEDWHVILKAEPMLDNLEKKMILTALNMPEYRKATQDPKTSFQARKTYRDLKEKIKENLKD